MILKKLKEKAQEVKSWAVEHPFLAATAIVAATLATGGVAYLVYRQFDGSEEIVLVEPVNLPEPKFTSEPPPIDMPEADDSSAYWLSYRREHLRDITPKRPSDQAKEEAARHGATATP